MSRHPWLLDAVIAAAILVSGAAVGAAYRRISFASGAVESFGQPEFGAAVSLACGRGYVGPGEQPPALDQFLHVERDRVSCADLPSSVPPRPPSMTQGIYRYLMMTTALVWRIRGISWSGLTPLYGLLYGLTLAAAYGVFRLLVGRIMAVVATVALMVSADHLQSLPQLRDYAKAPFVLALILIMGLIVKAPLRPRRTMALAIAFGVTLGIGLGFRNDLLINLLPWTAVVLFCLPGPVRSSVRLRLTCLAASGAAFLVVAWPILAAYSRGSNSGHVVLLGFVTAFDGPLGLGASISSWGYSYSDAFASTVIDSFANRTYGHGVAFLSPEYDRAMFAYILDIVRHWPADMLTRTYASVLKVIEFPFLPGLYSGRPAHGLADAVVLKFYDYEGGVLRALRGWAVIDVAAALLLIGATNVRAALTLLLFLVYLAGYPALQFHLRHFFHLEFIAWAALAFVIERVAVALGFLWRSRRSLLRADTWLAARQVSGRAVRNLVVVAGVAAVLIVGPVAVLRAYQVNHLRTMFSRDYLGSRRESLAFVTGPGAGRATAVTIPALWQTRDPRHTVSTEYLVIELSPTACDALYVPLAFKYEGYQGALDHSMDVPLVNGDQPTLVLSPVYYTASGHFSRIEVPEGTAHCLTRVSRIVAAEIPRVLIDADFTPHWQGNPLFQTIRDWETPAWAERIPDLYRVPPSAIVPPRSQPRPFAGADSPAMLAPIARRAPDGTLVIKGRPERFDSYVMQIDNQTLEAGSTLVCRGTIRRGGVTVGVLLDNHWDKTVNVATPGPFVVSLTVDTTAKYSVVLANFVLSGNSDVTISALGWLPPAGK